MDEQLFSDIRAYLAQPAPASDTLTEIFDQLDDIDRAYLAGQAGALLSSLIALLDDDRAGDMIALLDGLLLASPPAREWAIDKILEITAQ